MLMPMRKLTTSFSPVWIVVYASKNKYMYTVCILYVYIYNVQVCEMWWTQERPGGEHLVAQLLPLMLVRSIDEDAKEADVKRMYG